MYKSPIEITYDNNRQIVNKLDDEIYKAIIQEINIKIDKEELIKALEYDRKSYEEGFKNGYKEGVSDTTKAFNEKFSDMSESIESELISENDKQYSAINGYSFSCNINYD